MIIFKLGSELNTHILAHKGKGKNIGFVPTMGALHEGHISLIRVAKQKCEIVVASIFVNPTQFNNAQDFEKYPVTTAQDIEMLEGAGCDILYLPHERDIYPKGREVATTYDFGKLETVLEGAYRKDHFKGVGQVVSILLKTVVPNWLFLGQKDYQQCMIISSLVKQMGWNEQVQIEFVPTMREDDGLAMSSRNKRLTESQRSIAGVIYQCLISIVTKKNIADFAIVQKECQDLLIQKGFIPDYVSLADAETLELYDQYHPDHKMIALIAAHLGNVRLIDNMLVN